ncbi:hypothetical protein EVAR_61325_1 [Eumeta japonica]|uniref:Uncharacterized protein n=1 Tax=Eumeta variegata TaxID=151549 RepID=A0A4C1Y204_EUMVA|nr:hypothetical protein EVAR_61325_1 [Eumeta japonica]
MPGLYTPAGARTRRGRGKKSLLAKLLVALKVTRGVSSDLFIEGYMGPQAGLHLQGDQVKLLSLLRTELLSLGSDVITPALRPGDVYSVLSRRPPPAARPISRRRWLI